LRTRLRDHPPDLAPLGDALLRKGIVGVTDATPDNGPDAAERFAALPQRVLAMGGDALREGPRKFHLHEHDLPDLTDLTRAIVRAHDSGRVVAVHCVTHAALLLTLAALQDAGACVGDRIEHGAIITDDALAWIAQLGLTVVTQPHFLTERGDAYRSDVPADEQPFLYRLGSLVRSGIPVAAGSDAPFGDVDPWKSMHAAVHRPEGFGEHEAVTPEQALALYTTPAGNPGGAPRNIEPGAVAELCLLDCPWRLARENLPAVRVRAVWSGDLPVPAMFDADTDLEVHAPRHRTQGREA
jgi:predicted amidohydrolase YtcJ